MRRRRSRTRPRRVSPRPNLSPCRAGRRRRRSEFVPRRRPSRHGRPRWPTGRGAPRRARRRCRPTAVFSSTLPSRPVAATSADAVVHSRSESSGHRMRMPTAGVRPKVIQAGPTPKPLLPTPISTVTSLPFSSTVARSIASRVASSSRSASSTTVVRPVSLGSTEIRPAAFLTRRRVLPGVSNACTAGLLDLARRPDDAVVGRNGAAPVRKQQDSGAVRDRVKTGHVRLLS